MKGMKKTVLKHVGIIAAIAGSCVVLFGILTYALLFVPNFTRRTNPYTEKDNEKRWGNAEFEARNARDEAWWEASDRVRMEITSQDGLKLVAYYLPHENQKGIVLMMHGFHSTPLRDFASIARWHYEQGYAICLPYQRTHGESEGTYITFGVRERDDLLRWVNELNSRFGIENDVWIHGISMGCATAVMASGAGYPFNVRGVIADCGFTSPSEIIAAVLKDRHIPLKAAIVRIGDLFARCFAGFSLYDYSTFTALRTNETPMLFIHGTQDDFVPLAMGIANYEACRAPKELVLVENAIHAVSFYQDEALYTSSVRAFMERYALPR